MHFELHGIVQMQWMKTSHVAVLNVLWAEYSSVLKILLVLNWLTWRTKRGCPSSKILCFTWHCWSYSGFQIKKWIHLFNYLPNYCPLVLVQNTAYTFDLSRLLCSSPQVESKCSVETKRNKKVRQTWSCGVSMTRRKGGFLPNLRTGESVRGGRGGVGESQF